MSDDPLVANAALIAELKVAHARFRQELHKTLPYQRLIAIEGLLALLSGSVETAETPPGVGAATAAKAPRTGTVAAAVVEIGERYLRAKGSRAQTPEIAAEVQRSGLLPDATNVIATVSSYLSSAKDIFDNVRGEGYGLLEWQRQPATPSPGQLLVLGLVGDGNHVTLKEQTAAPIEEAAA